MTKLKSFVRGLAITLGAAGAMAAEELPTEKLDLIDGSTLFVHPDGTMRMVDVHGKPMAMEDGVEMELKDGRRLMMQNKIVWITIGPPGKGAAVKKPD